MRNLLTRHFLRRFVNNDLISPDADRHEVLAVIGAALLSSSLFLTVLLCIKYLFGIELPGPAAIWALDDRFLYIAGSMIITALATLAVWDALGLDARDAVILGPLPIPASVIMRAKLAALTLFGLGVRRDDQCGVSTLASGAARCQAACLARRSSPAHRRAWGRDDNGGGCSASW